VTTRIDLRAALDPSWLESTAARLLEGPVGTWSEPLLLAGGWYTHAATGSPPRDLDLFCQTAEALNAVAARLLERGATATEDRPPYFRRLVWHGQAIDLAYNVWCASLDELFAKFDLGLSMAGVRWCDGHAAARVSPLALASLDAGVALINQRCPNTKYCLVTIERAHRYAERLGLEPDTEGLAWLWSLIEHATVEEQRKMIERYRLVGVRDLSIERRALELVEAVCS
jgi:hypothetical protein